MAQQHRGDSSVIDTLIQGDALDVLKTLESNSVDAVCCDPPSGISFMNKSWDSNKGGRDAWIAWLAEIMREAMRCLRPGGHAVIWALPRTSHWTATALEDAGFEIRDVITHLFGSGFPKSQDISRAIDKLAGAEREVVGWKTTPDGKRAIDRHPTGFNGEHEGWDRPWKHDMESVGRQASITAPATPEAKQWQGYGTALKPASEHWILCRKPLSEKSIAENVLKHGTGGLNIDISRISTQDHLGRMNKDGENGWKNSSGGPSRATYDPVAASGRFPSNTLFSHSVFCVPLGTRKVKGDGHKTQNPRMIKNGSSFWGNGNDAELAGERYNDEDGLETVEAYECAEDCPVRLLDEQSKGTRADKPSASGLGGWRNQYVGGDTHAYYRGTSYHDQGGASRYFQTFHPSPDEYAPFLYCAKASRSERSQGCEGLPQYHVERVSGIGGDKVSRCPIHDTSYISGAVHYTCGCPHVYEGGTYKRVNPVQNNHPTVKPLQLMKYLINLITPEGGTVLDCFAGSGSTLVACVQSGFNFIGIEQSEEYCSIAEARIAYAREVVV